MTESNIGTAIIKANKLISELFPSIEAAVITGSFVDGTNSKYSDIDLILFSSIDQDFVVERMEYDNCNFDLIFIPIQNLSNIIKSDYFDYNGIYLNMIGKCIIVKDLINLILPLRKFCENLYSHKTIYRQYSLINQARSRFISTLDYFKSISSGGEIVFGVTALYQTILIYHKLINGNWSLKGKYNYLYLNQYYPEFISELDKASSTSILEMNPNGLVDFVENKLIKYLNCHYNLSTKDTLKVGYGTYIGIKIGINNIRNLITIFHKIPESNEIFILMEKGCAYAYIKNNNSDKIVETNIFCKYIKKEYLYEDMFSRSELYNYLFNIEFTNLNIDIFGACFRLNINILKFELLDVLFEFKLFVAYIFNYKMAFNLSNHELVCILKELIERYKVEVVLRSNVEFGKLIEMFELLDNSINLGKVKTIYKTFNLNDTNILLDFYRRFESSFKILRDKLSKIKLLVEKKIYINQIGFIFGNEKSVKRRVEIETLTKLLQCTLIDELKILTYMKLMIDTNYFDKLEDL